MKRLYLCVLVAFISLWFFGRSAQAGDSAQALYKAAKAEGEVVIWSPLDPWEVKMLAGEFNKDFPGIKVSHFEIRPDDYVPRVIAEARQGMVGLDMGTGRLVGLTPLLERNLVQAYDDWDKVFKDLNPAAVHEKGRVLSQYSLVYPVAHNTDLVKPADAPKSWEDLLASKWKGKIIVEPRANAFAYLGLKWGEEKVVNYLKKLKAHEPIFVKGGTGVAQQLVAGVAPLAVGAYVHKILQMKSDGAPIDWAKKVSPVGASDNVIFAVKDAKHPSAAKLFTGWLASDRAQRLMNAKMFRGTVTPGSPYAAMKDFEKHGVEIIRENLENHKRASAINKSAVKTLGVLR